METRERNGFGKNRRTRTKAIANERKGIFMDKRFIGIRDCAEYLGVTRGTLYVWVCHRKIPYLKVGRLVKFDLKAIEEWLKANAVAELN